MNDKVPKTIVMMAVNNGVYAIHPRESVRSARASRQRRNAIFIRAISSRVPTAGGRPTIDMFRQLRLEHVLLCRVWKFSKTEELRRKSSLAVLGRAALAQTDGGRGDASEGSHVSQE